MVEGRYFTEQNERQDVRPPRAWDLHKTDSANLEIFSS